MLDSVLDNNHAFFALLRGGLWEKDVKIAFCNRIDCSEIFRLSEEQSVLGLIAAGLEYVKDVKIPQEISLEFVGSALQLEQQNLTMNKFVASLIEKLRSVDIYVLLLKGQGIAQCYNKPLWRSSGDVDLFLSDDNYEKAKRFLMPLASSVDDEGLKNKHLGLMIDDFVVELHGTLYSGLSSRIENTLDDIKKSVFYEGKVRSWANGNTQVFLLAADEDVVYVFTHILQHFYKGGIGLRQICDWCRLLWTYMDSLNHGLLESRIRKAGLMSEWKAFGAFAVEYLGMPIDAVPLLDVRSLREDGRLRRKAERIKDFIMMSGNFGHNRDMSYYDKYPYLVRKVISLGRRCGDLFRHARVFPMDSIRFSFWIMLNGVRSAVRGE